MPFPDVRAWKVMFETMDDVDAADMGELKASDLNESIVGTLEKNRCGWLV